MITNPLIEDLEKCVGEGSTSTVNTKLLTQTIELMKQADEVIASADRLVNSLEGKE